MFVLDVRSAIDGGGAEAYQKGHIPGAIHSDYDKAGWRVTRGGVPFMLPTLPELEKLIGELGIDEDTHVVVVPAGVHYTDFGSAARTYWTLKVAGVAKVSILDGGYAAWSGRGEPDRERAASKPSPKIFTATLEQGAVRRRARRAGDRAIGRRDADRRAAGVVLRRQGAGARRQGLRAHSGRRECRQRDVLRSRDQPAEAAGGARRDRRDAARRAGGRPIATPDTGPRPTGSCSPKFSAARTCASITARWSTGPRMRAARLPRRAPSGTT